MLPDLDLLQKQVELHHQQLATLLPGEPVRVAILGGYTSQPIRAALSAVALLLDRRVEIYEATYNTFRTEVLNPGSGLLRFPSGICPIRNRLSKYRTISCHE